jgi:membrane-associated phospholipid phosphatase
MRSRRFGLALLLLVAAVGVSGGLSWTLNANGGMPLDGWRALVVYVITESGSARWVPLLLLVALGIWATDGAVPPARRRTECLAMLALMAVALPSVGLLNERVVKRAFEMPRPSHTRLADAGVIPDLEAFYRLDKSARRELLELRLPDAAGAAAAFGLHPVVLAHWKHETSSSFPSGHSLNAFIAAMLFVGGAVANATPRRRWLAAWMLIWAVAVAVSRVALLVHRPLDIVVGGLLGALTGMVLLLVWWRATASSRPRAPVASL